MTLVEKFLEKIWKDFESKETSSVVIMISSFQRKTESCCFEYHSYIFSKNL